MSRIETIAKGIELHPGDCLDVLAAMDDCSVDSCVTDPPYHLTSIVKRFGAPDAAPAKAGKTGAYKRASAGFMGKQWDGGDIAFRVDVWLQVLRVLKPGGHLLAFSGTRTYHRMASAIEDAGFEIRDQIGWAYGSGFPKSHNQKGDWQGWGTALKPAWEPVVLARKPLIGTVAENVLEHGTGALNIDGCRVATGENLNGGAYSGTLRDRDEQNQFAGGNMRRGIGRQAMPGDEREGAALGMFQPGKTVGSTYQQPPGRWPANIVHDGSDEVTGAFPDAPGQQRFVGPEHGERPSKGIYGDFGARPPNEPRGDSGSAARFFYTAKADADDRLGSKHPTVKPVDLMQWLVRMVTQKGGTVLDPFAGTGTTGEAAFREGMNAILIERETEYQDDIRRRMKLVLGGPDERRRESIKARGPDVDPGPLFERPTFSEIWKKPFYPDAAE